VDFGVLGEVAAAFLELFGDFEPLEAAELRGFVNIKPKVY